jgi:hypothetical protein
MLLCCRLSAGLTEEDFIGDAVREPLCSCLSKIAAALSALPVDGQLVHNTTELKPAIDSLKVRAKLPLLWLLHCMLLVSGKHHKW